MSCDVIDSLETASPLRRSNIDELSKQILEPLNTFANEFPSDQIFNQLLSSNQATFIEEPVLSTSIVKFRALISHLTKYYFYM